MELHYSEPRFRMPYWGRFAVRLLTYAGGAFFVAVGLVMCFSEMIQFRVIAYLILILALYYLLKIGRADRSIKNVSEKHRNIAEYLSPSGYRLLEVAIDRTALENTDFTLNLLCELLKKSETRAVISALEIIPDEFIDKTHSRRERQIKKQSSEEIADIMSHLMILAFNIAQNAGDDAVRPEHIFKALLKGDFPEILKTFEIFGHKATDAL